ncbi:ATP-binding cassette domain-containing protein [Streptosporangium sp. NPDC023615]|uniref:ATP-binding cassette domain-containing protein n=1 Tax=Streptosporangium sp. NPDC023615 TaxID=3154794 RepID=UPI00341A8B21
MTSSLAEPLLEARNVVKTFGHVQALRGADFAVGAGEVVALMGDNGAGKSTLIKILSGVQPPTSGEVLMDGEPVELRSPDAARALGIETVYQDLALADSLDAASNLFLGREHMRSGLLGRLGFLDKKTMRSEAARVFSELSVTVTPGGQTVRGMSGGQRQGVAVCRAVMWANRVVFMDEPTAALGVAQTRNVLDLIKRVRDRGIAVVLISHSVPDVLDVADRIEVLRLGRRVARLDARVTNTQEVVAAITGARQEEMR